MSPLNKWKGVGRQLLDSLPRFLLFGPSYGRCQELCRRSEAGLLPVEEFQRAALAAQLIHALKTVPFYRRNYSIDPDRITAENAFETLRRFDYLDKPTVMASRDELVSTVYRKGSLLSKTSGGSTGQGVRIYYDRRELGIERAYVEYPWYRLGYRPHSLIVQAGAATRREQTQSPFSRGLRRVYLSCEHCTPKWMPHILDTLLRIRPAFVHGYPSIWEQIARAFKERGQRLPVRGVLLGSEQVFPDQIALFREVFGPIALSYGLTERVALGYGEIRNDAIEYRFEPTYACVENAPSPSGLPEIVGTSLFVKVMPFIRYRTEDLGRIENGRLASLDGRSQELVITKLGTAVSGTSLIIDSFAWDYVESYQFAQDTPGKILLHVVRRSNYNADVEKRLLASQKERVGSLFDVEIVYVDTLNRTGAGKRRLVISNVNRAAAYPSSTVLGSASSRPGGE